MSLDYRLSAVTTTVTALLALTSAVPAGAAESEKSETAYIGELLLPFDPKVWRVDGEDSHLVFNQVEDGFDGLGIGVSVTAGAEDGCSVETVLAEASVTRPGGSDARAFTLVKSGFDLHVATASLGCRNWTGSPVFACTFYREKLYSFAAPGDACGTPPNYDDPVIELLGGLTAPT